LVTNVELGDGGGVVVDDDGPGGDDHGDRPHAVDGRQETLDERHLGGAADAQDIQVRLLPLADRLPAAVAIVVVTAVVVVVVTAALGRCLHGRSRHLGGPQGQGPRRASGNAKRRAPAGPAKNLATGCSFILGVAGSRVFRFLPMNSYFGSCASLETRLISFSFDAAFLAHHHQPNSMKPDLF